MSISGDSPAFLFEDRQTPGDWHVRWTDDEDGFEMAIFSGPRARERAIIFAERCYGRYEFDGDACHDDIPPLLCGENTFRHPHP